MLRRTSGSMLFGRTNGWIFGIGVSIDRLRSEIFSLILLTFILFLILKSIGEERSLIFLFVMSRLVQILLKSHFGFLFFFSCQDVSHLTFPFLNIVVVFTTLPLLQSKKTAWPFILFIFMSSYLIHSFSFRSHFWFLISSMISSMFCFGISLIEERNEPQCVSLSPGFFVPFLIGGFLSLLLESEL